MKGYQFLYTCKQLKPVASGEGRTHSRDQTKGSCHLKCLCHLCQFPGGAVYCSLITYWVIQHIFRPVQPAAAVRPV